MDRTFEAVVINGQILLQGSVELPDHTRVFVIVPDTLESVNRRIHTPRLAHPEQARDFQMEVIDEAPNAVV